MSRAVDAVVGVVVGAIVWFILDLILSPIPILGWIIAAMVAGYVAGRLGGSLAGIILAVFTPVVTFLLGSAILTYVIHIASSYVPELAQVWGLVFSVLGSALVIYTGIEATINLIFVGTGAAIGARSYNRSKGKRANEVRRPAAQRPPQGAVGVAVAPGTAGPTAVTASPPAAPAGAQAARPAQSPPLPQRLVEAYMRARSDPSVQDKSFRNAAYVTYISGIARRTEETAKELVRSLPDQQRAMFTGLLRDTVMEEFRRQLPNLDPPDLNDPLGSGLVDAVKDALKRGIAQGRVTPRGAKSQDDVERMVELTASEVVMGSLITFLSYMGAVRLT